MAAFHHWTFSEREKVNALIRKTYKAALGLPANTNTEKLRALGVHNNLEEIEAQHTSQLIRLTATPTGRAILK